MADAGKMVIPEQGRPKEEVLEALGRFKQGDADYKRSRTWSLVYYLGEEHTQFLAQAFAMFMSENALNPMAFRSLRKMEHEVVRMTAHLLGGGEEAVGVMTSGGTESCLLAVLAYRDRAAARPWTRWRRPEMIVPESAHVAWEKAAHYFGVKVVRAPLRDDLRVDVDAVARLVNKNTILVVASAPSYPHGVVDPIAELGRLAEDRGVPLHVDSCLGGFVLPFMERLGYPVPPFDFRVPGVTSIAADVHKYGYAAKGASVLLYRSMEYLKHQFFVYENWPGGVFASPGLLGTRSGGAIAAAWATLNAMGVQGYMELTRSVMETTGALQAGIRGVGLDILSDPEMSVFAYGPGAEKLNIYAVADQMEQRGWLMDRLQRPEALHAMVTPLHQRIVDSFVNDLRESVEYVRANPQAGRSGSAATYGMIAKVPVRRLVKNEVRKMMEQMYGPDMKMPL